MSDPRLADYLGHIVAAVERIQDYIRDFDKDQFLADGRTQDAVIRNLEIIGEASHRIETRYPELAQAYPEIPFAPAYQMRNAVAHGYFAVDFDIVWATITTDLPRLAVLVGELLADER